MTSLPAPPSCRNVQRCLSIALFLVLWLLSSSLQAEPHRNALLAVQVDQHDDRLEVRIRLRAAPAYPVSTFSMTAPPRIVIDLPETENASDIRRKNADTGLLHEIMIAESSGRSRLVLTLGAVSAYTVRTEAETVVIDIPASPASKESHSATITDQTDSVRQPDHRLAPPVAASHASRDASQRSHGPYQGNKLSLQFQNINVRAVLQVLADFTGINMIASDTVSGALTLRLKDVPWDQALDIVLQARNLEMRRHGNVMWIAPRDEMLAKERQELEKRAHMTELASLRAEVFQLNYQKAEIFRDVFGEGSGSQPKERKNSLLSRRGSAVVDQRTNQLFVTDTPEVLENIRALLKKIDIAARQVLIEVRIVEAEDSFSRNLGVRLGLAPRTNGAGIGDADLQTGDAAAQANASGASAGRHFAVNLPASAIGTAAAGNFALSLFHAGASRFLDLELSALEADGKGKIISNPRVVTADQQAALIEQGEEIPYQQATSSGATAIAFKKANLKLEVTPQIAPNGNVILSVDINKDSRGTATPGGLAINTKHVKTLVQVENGGTVAIGGIYTQTVSQSTTKIPLLGDIPVLGRLFRSTARMDNKTELLIFLTPKIVEVRSDP